MSLETQSTDDFVTEGQRMLDVLDVFIARRTRELSHAEGLRAVLSQFIAPSHPKPLWEEAQGAPPPAIDKPGMAEVLRRVDESMAEEAQASADKQAAPDPAYDWDETPLPNPLAKEKEGAA